MHKTEKVSDNGLRKFKCNYTNDKLYFFTLIVDYEYSEFGNNQYPRVLDKINSTFRVSFKIILKILFHLMYVHSYFGKIVKITRDFYEIQSYRKTFDDCILILNPLYIYESLTNRVTFS